MVVSVYLDTNAIIQFLERQDEELRHFFRRFNATGRRIITSELTIAETLVGPLQAKFPAVVAMYENFFASTLIETCSIDRIVLRKSAELRAEFGGKLPDTVHIATAILTGCRAIVSSDKRLRMPDSLPRIEIDDLTEWERLV